jgi:molybdate transport system substrate-binding protein
MPRLFAILLSGLVMTLGACERPPAERAPVVLAAVSLQEALEEAADVWSAQGHVPPVLSFAGSAALARQIENGAPADVFISADEAWMDNVQRRGLLKPGARRILAGNALVLIAPISRKDVSVPLDAADLARALGDGRLAMADPETVPAGRYGKAALVTLGLWREVEGHVAPGENVRAALKLVERDEAPLGLVYATDARASSKVRVVARFPASSHPPIVYPIALVAGGRADGGPFQAFLLSSAGQAVLTRHGFTPGPGD